MTALDILDKHAKANGYEDFDQARELANPYWVPEIALAAMREIYELGDRDGYKRRDDELERTTTEIDLEDRLKQLFPEK